MEKIFHFHENLFILFFSLQTKSMRDSIKKTKTKI